MVRYLCLLLCLFGGGRALADDAAKDKKQIEGLWQAVALEADGRQAPAGELKKFQLRFKGDQVVFDPEADNREHAFEIDPSANPKAMDLTPGDGPAKGKKLPCAIYRLDGDKLVICMDKEGQTGKRPTEFKTAAGDGLALITLERVKKSK